MFGPSRIDVSETANDIERTILRRVTQYAQQAAADFANTLVEPPLTDDVARLIDRLLSQSLGKSIRQAIDQLDDCGEHDAAAFLQSWTEESVSISFERRGNHAIAMQAFLIPVLLMSPVVSAPPRAVNSDMIAELNQSFLTARTITTEIVSMIPTLYQIDEIPRYDEWDQWRQQLRRALVDTNDTYLRSSGKLVEGHVFLRFLIGFIQTPTISYGCDTPFLDDFDTISNWNDMAEEILTRGTNWIVRVAFPSRRDYALTSGEHLERSQGTLFHIQSFCHDRDIAPAEFIANLTWDKSQEAWSIRSGNAKLPRDSVVFTGVPDSPFNAEVSLSDLICDLWEVGIRQFHIDGSKL